MKFICNGIEFSNALTTVVKACSTKTTNAILEMIQIKAENDSIILLATDEEITIQKTFPAEIMQEGEICVHGRTITDFIKKLEDETLTISTEEDNLLIEYASSQTNLKYQKSDIFPVMNLQVTENKLQLLGSQLKEIVNKITIFCAQDESRPVLKGCLFKVEKDRLSVIALDGFRMAKMQLKIEPVDNAFHVVCPARTLIEIAKLIPDTEDITLYFQKNRLMLALKDTLFSSRLIEDEFVNIAGIIPTEFQTKMIVNRKNLQKSVDRAAIFVKNERNNVVTFHIKENKLQVTSVNERGNVHEELAIQFEGVDLKIAMNSKYIADAIHALPTEEILISFNNNLSPFLLTPVENDNYLYLILPIRINE